VQRVRFQHVLSSQASRNCQLFVPVIQIFLGKVEANPFEHLAANGGRRPVTSNDDVGLHASLIAADLVTQLNGARLQIYTHTALLKEDFDSLRLSSIHQRNIQIRARNRVDHLRFIFSIRLEGQFSTDGVHHSPLHRDDDLPHVAPEARLSERMNSADREREIDRAAGADWNAPHVRPPLVDLNLETATDQTERQ
jgi:hypothetical protein